LKGFSFFVPSSILYFSLLILFYLSSYSTLHNVCISFYLSWRKVTPHFAFIETKRCT